MKREYIYVAISVFMLQGCAVLGDQLIKKEPGVVKMAVNEYRIEFGVKNSSDIDKTLNEQGSQLCESKYNIVDKEIEDVPKLYTKVIATIKCR